MVHTFLPLQQAISVGARGRGSGSGVWSGRWQKSWGEPCARCHWQPDIAIYFRMRQGRVDETHAPLSDLESVPASTTMWQPGSCTGHAAIFDIGRTTSNTPSYLEQVRRTAPSSRSIHPHPAGAARYHPIWVSEGLNRLPVHVEKSSPPLLCSAQSHAYTHVENNHQQEIRQTAMDIMFGWTWPDYSVATAQSQSQHHGVWAFESGRGLSKRGRRFGCSP